MHFKGLVKSLAASGRVAACFRAGALLLLAAGLVTGCQRTDRLDQKVSARSPIAFTTWQTDLADEFTAEEQKDIADLIQEIRFDIMAGQKNSDSAEVDEALRARLEGHPLRETLRQGYELRVRRLQDQRVELEHMMQKNSGLGTKPGDTASAEYLANKIKQQAARLEDLDREILATQKKFNRLFKLPESSPLPSAASPTEMPVRVLPQGAESPRTESPPAATQR